MDKATKERLEVIAENAQNKGGYGESSRSLPTNPILLQVEAY